MTEICKNSILITAYNNYLATGSQLHLYLTGLCGLPEPLAVIDIDGEGLHTPSPLQNKFYEGCESTLN